MTDDLIRMRQVDSIFFCLAGAAGFNPESKREGPLVIRVVSGHVRDCISRHRPTGRSSGDAVRAEVLAESTGMESEVAVHGI